MEVCERVGTSRMILGILTECRLEVNDGSYFCFSDCVALTTTVPFHRLLAITAFIFRAADFIGNYTHLINGKCTGSLNMLIG